MVCTGGEVALGRESHTCARARVLASDVGGTRQARQRGAQRQWAKTMNPPACANESFSESRETRRNLTRRQLPWDAAAVSSPIRDFLSVKKK